jgi:hypothetical protein
VTKYVVLHFPEEFGKSDMDEIMIGTPTRRGLGTCAIAEAIYGATLMFVVQSNVNSSPKQYLVGKLSELRKFPDFMDYAKDEIVGLLGCVVQNARILVVDTGEDMIRRGTIEVQNAIARSGSISTKHQIIHLVPPAALSGYVDSLAQMHNGFDFPGTIGVLTTHP